MMNPAIEPFPDTLSVISPLHISSFKYFLILYTKITKKSAFNFLFSVSFDTVLTCCS